MMDSQTSISSLELTKNPFESDYENRVNFPGFSPSMFTTPKTLISRKEKEFRWSIEQISRLYPVDMNEFPNQEYSSTFEREEDEQAAQEAINEYFSQDAIVPSPWTPNRSAKHVTFSPLPPDTQYIPNNECSMDSSYTTQTHSLKMTQVEAGTQTSLSIPLNINLEEIITSSAFQTFMLNNPDDIKDLSASSLRRKLFPQENQTDRHTDANNNSAKNTKIRSILKTSKSPVLTTSSPVSFNTSYPEKSPIPDVSPIRAGNTPINKLRCSRMSLGPGCMSNGSSIVCVLESSGIDRDLNMFPDISPIRYDAVPHDQDSKQNEKKEPEDKTTDDHESGGCLKTSMLHVATHDNHPNDDSTSECDSDDKPAKITMEDLASDSSIIDDQQLEGFGGEEKPPGVSMEDLSSPGDINMTKDDRKNENDDEAMETSMTNVLCSTKYPEDDDKPSYELLVNKEQYTNTSDVGFTWRKKPEMRETPSNSLHNTYDEDIIMIKAAAALRRANRFTPTSMTNSEYGRPCTKPDNIPTPGMDISGLPWHPMSMSTPLNLPPMRQRAFGSSLDNEEFDSTSFRQDRDNNMITRNYESDVFRSHGCNYGDSACQSRNGTKKLSPVMEDILRRREILKNTIKDVQNDNWIKPLSQTYRSPVAGKWRTPRTFPLSNVDRKTLYGKLSYRQSDYIDAYSPQLYSETRFDSKRTSWPPSRVLNGRRPTSPIDWPATSTVYSRNPEGCVTRMPIPASYTHSNIDSGFDEWKKSITKWERSMRIQNVNLKS